MGQLKGRYKRYRRRLQDLLLECQSIKDVPTRGAVIDELPEEIRANLNEKLPNLTAIVNNLIRVCDDYPDGIPVLLEAISANEDATQTLVNARQGWEKMVEEMKVQDELIAYIDRSDLAFEKLQQLYRESWQTGFDDEREPVNSVDDIITNLWEYHEHGKLIWQFMGRVMKDTENQNLRAEIQDWIQKAHLVKVLDLDQQVVKALAQGPQPNSAEPSPALIFVISPTIHDPNRFNISAYKCCENRSLKLVEKNDEIAKKNLERRITYMIDDITIDLAPKLPEVIEFYLPRSQLNLEVDQLYIGNQSVLEICPVVVATLTRQKMLFYIKNKNRSKGIRPERMTFFRDLIRSFSRWADKWQQLNQLDGKSFAELMQPVDRDEIKDLDTLRIRLSPADINCVAFDFNPWGVENYKFEDLLEPPLLSGTPVIFWSRKVEQYSEHSQNIKDAIQECIYDQCQVEQITSARDIIQMVHCIRRSALINDKDDHLGRNLVLILDNPEREIPILIQNKGL